MHTILAPATDGWIAQEQPRLYSGREIFEYMDGAGEVYLAYRFRALLVQRYSRPDQEEILAEIFDMGSPGNAFGISTCMRGRGPAVRIGQDGEYKSGLLTFWRGQYYVCLRVEKENTAATAAMRKMGRAMARAIGVDGLRPRLLRCLPEGTYRPESLRYFYRDEILRMHITLPRDDMLLLSDSTEGLLVLSRRDRSRILVVRYPDSIQAGAALRGFVAGFMPQAGGERVALTGDGTWAACGRKAEYFAAVINAPARRRAEAILESTMRRVR